MRFILICCIVIIATFKSSTPTSKIVPTPMRVGCCCPLSSEPLNLLDPLRSKSLVFWKLVQAHAVGTGVRTAGGNTAFHYLAIRLPSTAVASCVLTGMVCTYTSVQLMTKSLTTPQ